MIQAILTDIDGTLITGGNLNAIDASVKRAVKEAREAEILFSLASARSWQEQEPFHRLLLSPDTYKEGEAILYEASCIRLLGHEESHRLGGLSKTEIEEVERFVREHNLFAEMAQQQHQHYYETATGYVTPTFLSKGKTDVALLERTFHRVQPILEKQFPFLYVGLAADAIDIMAKGVSKALPAQKYAELTGIPLENIAAIGDSGNDMPLFKLIGDAGGLVIYVGVRQEQEEEVRKYKNHFIPKEKGPKGTVEGLKYLLS